MIDADGATFLEHRQHSHGSGYWNFIPTGNMAQNRPENSIAYELNSSPLELKFL